MSFKKLSESELWSLMTSFYKNIGPEAWNDDIVPTEISSNKFLAHIYADMIISSIEDHESKLENSNPIHILEIGSGHGRLGFYILKIIKHHFNNDLSLMATKIKYIISDITIKNIDNCMNNHLFNEFIECGVLDFALFNAITDININLIVSKKTISNQSLNSPLIAICNYLIDTLPHDSFKIINNKKHETLIEITSNSHDISDSNLDSLNYEFKDIPIKDDYYEQDDLNAILNEYEQYFTKQGSFLIPIGGINCIKNLEKFTSSKLITFIADKCNVDLNELSNHDNPEISLHGSISLMVNLDCLKRVTEKNGGTALLMPNIYSDFQVSCLISNSNNNSKLSDSFRKSLAMVTPQDLYHLCYVNDEINPSIISLDTCLSILSISQWDPSVLSLLSEKISDFISDEDTELYVQQENILLSGIKISLDYFYKFGTSHDLYFDAGIIYYALEYYEEAMNTFQLSKTHFGSSDEVRENIESCMSNLKINQHECC